MKDSDFISDSTMSIMKTENHDVIKAIANQINEDPIKKLPCFNNMLIFSGFGPDGKGIPFDDKSPEYIKSVLAGVNGFTFIHYKNNSFHNQAIEFTKRFPDQPIVCNYMTIRNTEKNVSMETVRVEYINGEYTVIETETNPAN